MTTVKSTKRYRSKLTKKRTKFITVCTTLKILTFLNRQARLLKMSRNELLNQILHAELVMAVELQKQAKETKRG
jgi:hypothetical protein